MNVVRMFIYIQHDITIFNYLPKGNFVLDRNCFYRYPFENGTIGKVSPSRVATSEFVSKFAYFKGYVGDSKFRV